METNRKRFFRLLAIAVFLGAVVVAVVLLGRFNPHPITGNGKTPQDYARANNSIQLSDRAYQAKVDAENYLVIGLDSDGPLKANNAYYNTDQADFLFVIAVDRVTKTVDFVRVNRDTMTEIQMLDIAGRKVGKKVAQIALSHTYGDGTSVSCYNTVDAVSALLKDVPIDHYLAMTMPAVSIINDHVGGVTVDGDTLDGTAALNYVRARMTLETGTNLERQERQNKYLHSLISVLQTQNIDNSYVNSLYGKIEDYVLTDCSTSQISDLATCMNTYSFRDITNIDGEVVYAKYAEFYPDEGSIEDVIRQVFVE